MTASRLLISIDNHIPLPVPYHQDPEAVRQSIARLLEILKPARVTAFAVGHDGRAQYPSTVLPRVPGMGFDLVAIWRDMVRQAGVEFFIYVSSLRNDIVREQNPEYARCFSNGNRAQVLDHNSRFLEALLLPTLQELIDGYDPDGFFFDADFWTLHDSWHPDTLLAFTQATGLSTPVDFGDANFSAFRAFTYESYRDYVGKMAAFFAGQARLVNWTINGAYSFRDPSNVPTGMARTTVDMPPFYGLVESYLEAHFAQLRSREFDINFPRFMHPEGSDRSQSKSPVQLGQELAVSHAASSLAHFYLPMRHDGTIPSDELVPLAAELQRFSLVFGPTPVERGYSLANGAAVLHSNQHTQTTRDLAPIRGAAMALLAGGAPFRMLGDGQLAAQAPEVLVIADTVAHSTELLERVGVLVMAGTPLVVTDHALLSDPGLERAIGRVVDVAALREDGAARQVALPSGSVVLWLPGAPFIDFNTTLDLRPLQTLFALLRRESAFPLTVVAKDDYVFVKSYAMAAGDRVLLCLSNMSFGGAALARHCYYDKIPLAGPIQVVGNRPILSASQVTDAGVIPLSVVGDRFETAPFEVYSIVEVALGG